MARKLHFGYNLSRLLSTGIWRPLRYWAYICIAIVLVLAAVSLCIPGITWVEMVGGFLDPGVFGGLAERTLGRPWLRLGLFGVSVLSIFFVASLLVSMISNTFNNIAYAYHNGDLRKALKDHVVIIGTGDAVGEVLKQSQKENRDVVVFALTCPHLDGEYYFYRGDKTCKADLESIGIETANKIYILSDKLVADDDIRCLACLDILKELLQKSDRKVHCYVIVNDFTTNEIFCYSRNQGQPESSNLFLVDIINSHEYIAEQLMLHTDFMPIVRPEARERVNLVILGGGNIARGIAYTAAHMCHYPHLDGQIRKTRITILDREAGAFMDEFRASRPGMCALSTCIYCDEKGERTVIAPARDYQDIEWEFVALSPISARGQQFLCDREAESGRSVHYVVCPEDERLIPSLVQHLPRVCYRHPIAVYAHQSESMIHRANSTGMYGQLIPFGFNCTTFDGELLTQRAERGKRVNFVYHQAYTQPEERAKDPEEAWYRIPESDKLSSIYCALAFGVRSRCFDPADRPALYEAEHRRWMTSVLLLGYAYSETMDKKHFLHKDLIPFEELTKGEQDKDQLLLDAGEYITKG